MDGGGVLSFLVAREKYGAPTTIKQRKGNIIRPSGGVGWLNE